MQKPTLSNHILAIGLLPFVAVVIIPGVLLLNFGGEWGFGRGSLIQLLASILGCFAIIDGIALTGYCIYLFHYRGQGTLAPWQPTEKLVVMSIYAYVRNPMLIGITLTLIGETLLFWSNSLLIWCLLFIVGNVFYLAWVEEPALYKQHGQLYVDYLQRVPRWIPKFFGGKRSRMKSDGLFDKK